MNTERTSLFLMANLGSEVSQVFSFAEKNEWKFAESAVSRANMIISELLLCPDMKGRVGEIKILQDIITDVTAKKRRFAINKAEMEEYFMPFALQAMSV